MKKIELENKDLYIGTAREICTLYKKLVDKEIAWPIFSDMPKFNMTKYYGLAVQYFDIDGEPLEVPEMQVVSGDTALAIAFDL